mgnify:CR=1
MRILLARASVLFFHTYKANEENGEWSVIRYRRDATGIWIVFQPPSAFQTYKENKSAETQLYTHGNPYTLQS